MVCASGRCPTAMTPAITACYACTQGGTQAALCTPLLARTPGLPLTLNSRMLVVSEVTGVTYSLAIDGRMWRVSR